MMCVFYQTVFPSKDQCLSSATNQHGALHLSLVVVVVVVVVIVVVIVVAALVQQKRPHVWPNNSYQLPLSVPVVLDFCHFCPSGRPHVLHVQNKTARRRRGLNWGSELKHMCVVSWPASANFPRSWAFTFWVLWVGDGLSHGLCMGESDEWGQPVDER